MPVPLDWKCQVISAYETLKYERTRGDALKIDLAESVLNALLEQHSGTGVTDVTGHPKKEG